MDIHDPADRNRIPIGLIGSSLAVEKMTHVIRTFPSFDPVTRTYDHEDDAPRIAQEMTMNGEVEVLLLFGPYLHRKVKEKLTTGVPIHYVPVTDAGLYAALFRLAAVGASRSSALSVSVDTLTQSMVKRALKDMGSGHITFQCYSGPPHASLEELTAFHTNAVRSGQATVALTGVEAVAEALRRSGIAHELLVPSEQDIIVSLERALLSTETRRSKEAQIVVGMINVDDFGRLVQNRTNEHEVQKLKLDIHRMVIDYVESLDGYSTHLGGDEYLFFTTRGIFERETGGYKTIPLAKEVNKAYGVSLSIGMGFGITANDAGTNARSALRKAKEAGGNSCFIVREDKSLIGPLEMAEPVMQVLSLTDSDLIKRAENAGMTSAYLSKLLQNTARTGKQEYQVHELAQLLGITVRSAHRLLQIWIDNGLADISGVEKVPRGRPRQLFRFDFLTDKDR